MKHTAMGRQLAAAVSYSNNIKQLNNKFHQEKQVVAARIDSSALRSNKADKTNTVVPSPHKHRAPGTRGRGPNLLVLGGSAKFAQFVTVGQRAPALYFIST
ncbi:unnamed protein product [Spodoptera littoralis]|uniref:Uncharacterized protein n=1 Tax=Spodoptera littoralis TaxID=7109 RepID=A0A9P0IBR7_SPOLI|nr:unnamed protein product [Spodoptera littoralis]CAH1643810.1 unnamed protein product [Spodoptera littoralis]